MARRGQTTRRKVVVVGPTGAETRAEADVSEHESDDGSSALLSGFLLAILLVPGIFFPPLLMLNLPLLFLRSYMSQAWAEAYKGVVLDPFECPECGAANPTAEHTGALPFDTKCAGCGASLTVRPPARRNLALESAKIPGV